MVRVQAEPIRGEDVQRVVGSTVDGATVLFLGTVRDHNRGRKVLRLEYQAYPKMAEAEMAKIVEESKRRFGISQMAMVHRTGELEIGDVAVAVAVSAAHRAEAIEACRFAMDTLKQTVPIWKKEFFEGGEDWIEDQPNSSSSRSSSSNPR